MIFMPDIRYHEELCGYDLQNIPPPPSLNIRNLAIMEAALAWPRTRALRCRARPFHHRKPHFVFPTRILPPLRKVCTSAIIHHTTTQKSCPLRVPIFISPLSPIFPKNKKEALCPPPHPLSNQEWITRMMVRGKR